MLLGFWPGNHRTQRGCFTFTPQIQTWFPLLHDPEFNTSQGTVPTDAELNDVLIFNTRSMSSLMHAYVSWSHFVVVHHKEFMMPRGNVPTAAELNYFSVYSDNLLTGITMHLRYDVLWREFDSWCHSLWMHYSSFVVRSRFQAVDYVQANVRCVFTHQMSACSNSSADSGYSIHDGALTSTIVYGPLY